MPPSARQRARAKRNEELRGLATQIARLTAERDTAEKLCEQHCARADRLEREVETLKELPVESVRKVLERLTLSAALELDLVNAGADLLTWLRDVDRTRRVAAGNGGV